MISFISTQPKLLLQSTYSRSATFVMQLIKPKETSRNNLAGADVWRHHHIQIFVERWRKCTSKGQLTRILITLVFVPQFFLSSIFWKRIRIQGLVAVAWGNRKREIVGSLFSSIFNYQTRWMDGWLSEIWKTGLRITRSGHQAISWIWDSLAQPRQSPLAVADTPGFKRKYKECQRGGNETTA